MLTSAALILCLVGLVVSITLQAWVQPKNFREDNKRQADLIMGRFDAQLESLKFVSENASRTLDEAAKFFVVSEEKFVEIHQRLGILEQQWQTTHRLVDLVTRLDKRLSCVEAVCESRHENSIRVQRDHVNDSNGDFER